MKRVEIEYMGKSYTRPHTTAETVRTEIEEGLATTKPFWLKANFGEGKPQPVTLLITPGIGITVADMNVDEETGDITARSHEFTGPDHTTAEHNNENQNNEELV